LWIKLFYKISSRLFKFIFFFYNISNWPKNSIWQIFCTKIFDFLVAEPLNAIFWYFDVLKQIFFFILDFSIFKRVYSVWLQVSKFCFKVFQNATSIDSMISWLVQKHSNCYSSSTFSPWYWLLIANILNKPIAQHNFRYLNYGSFVVTMPTSNCENSYYTIFSRV
jgi:hypothetical protein